MCAIKPCGNMARDCETVANTSHRRILCVLFGGVFVPFGTVWFDLGLVCTVISFSLAFNGARVAIHSYIKK